MADLIQLTFYFVAVRRPAGRKELAAATKSRVPTADPHHLRVRFVMGHLSPFPERKQKSPATTFRGGQLLEPSPRSASARRAVQRLKRNRGCRVPPQSLSFHTRTPNSSIANPLHPFTTGRADFGGVPVHQACADPAARVLVRNGPALARHVMTLIGLAVGGPPAAIIPLVEKSDPPTRPPPSQ